MASDKHITSNASGIWHHSSVRYYKNSSDSFDNELSAKNDQAQKGIPKFLRSKSSSGLLLTPKKSIGARFFGSLMQTSFSESLGTKEKNCNYSSLNNLSRLVSPAKRNTKLNLSKSLRSVDHIIDENSVFGSSLSSPLESSPRLSSRYSRYRQHQFRRRSISWDSSDNRNALIRYDYYVFNMDKIPQSLPVYSGFSFRTWLSQQVKHLNFKLVPEFTKMKGNSFKHD